MCTPVILQAEKGGGGFRPPTKFSKSWDLTGPQLLEVNFWERGSDVFQGWPERGGLKFSHEKLKSEIFNSKNIFLSHN